VVTNDEAQARAFDLTAAINLRRGVCSLGGRAVT
jgi:hypothetical protein